MKILDIQKRDVYVALEFSITEILHLAKVMDLALVNYERDDQDAVEAVKWMHETLEPQLEWFQTEFSKDDGPHDSGS